MATDVTLKEIREFFGMSAGAFAAQWRAMTTHDRAQIKSGLTDGSLTY